MGGNKCCIGKYITMLTITVSKFSLIYGGKKAISDFWLKRRFPSTKWMQVTPWKIIRGCKIVGANRFVLWFGFFIERCLTPKEPKLDLS